MGIRVLTLKELARRKRSIYRVRWRLWERLGDGKIQVDEDGASSNPRTWGRWEEGYYLTAKQADHALKTDPHKHLRPRGHIDQVPAFELWSALNRESVGDGGDQDQLNNYEDGRHRVIGPVESWPDRFKCDQKC